MNLTKIGLLAVAAAAIAAPAAVLAQEDSGPLLSVRIVQVKSGMVGEWTDQIRKLAAANREAGRPSANVWQVVRGPLNTFHIVSEIENYGQLDEPFEPAMDDGDWASWVSRITSYSDSSQFLLLQTHPDLSIPPAEGSERSLLTLRLRTVAWGQNDAYHNWVRDDLIPALRDGGAQGVSYSRVVAGDNTRTWVGASRFDSWADLDGPGVLADMSDRQRRSLFSDANDIVENGVNYTLRHRAELSW